MSFRLYNGKAWFDTIGFAHAGGASLGRKAELIVASITADFIDRPVAPLATAPSRRYSLYTPELQLLAETDFTTAATPAIANEYVYFGDPLGRERACVCEIPLPLCGRGCREATGKGISGAALPPL